MNLFSTPLIHLQMDITCRKHHNIVACINFIQQFQIATVVIPSIYRCRIHIKRSNCKKLYQDLYLCSNRMQYDPSHKSARTNQIENSKWCLCLPCTSTMIRIRSTDIFSTLLAKRFALLCSISVSSDQNIANRHW